MTEESQKLTDRKRRDIVQAAIAIFVEKGYQGARTTEIAKRANVSSRTLYNHFDSKEALFSEIVQTLFEDTSNLSVVPFDSEQPIRDQLIKAVEDYLDHLLSERMLGIARMIYAEFVRDNKLAQRAYSRVESQDDPIRTIIVQAMEAGSIKEADIEIAVLQLTSMIKGLFHHSAILLGEPFEFSKSRSAVIAECVDMFLAYYEV